MAIKFLLIVLFISTGISAVNAQDYSKKELNYKPRDLKESVAQLHKIHHDSTKQKIRGMSESEFLSGAHFGLGMWMRNQWGLWGHKSLADYFNSIGIFHPDDMSSIILISYYRDLTGQPWDVNNQVKYYQDYWKKQEEHRMKMETDTAYQDQVKSRYDSTMSAHLELKKSHWTKGKKVRGYIDRQCGLLTGGMKTEVEGTIVDWKDDILIIHIDFYTDPDKKEKVIKCNSIINDEVSIKKHDQFRLVKNQ
jgi:hypothetical protein